MAISSRYHLEIFDTSEKLNQEAADFIVKIGSKSIRLRNKFVIALSGGHTPDKIYSLLATPVYSEKMDWNKIHVFWGDERCVSLDDKRNNAHQAIKGLLDKVNIPKENIHRIPVSLSPKEAALQYQLDITDFFAGDQPRFDLILLGLGENGHTASLFPGTDVIEEKRALVQEVYVEEEDLFRVTMTAPLINQAHEVLFLVSGEKKAEILKQVLHDQYQPDLLPAQLIKPVHGKLWWYVDRAAASAWPEN